MEGNHPEIRLKYANQHFPCPIRNTWHGKTVEVSLAYFRLPEGYATRYSTCWEKSPSHQLSHTPIGRLSLRTRRNATLAGRISSDAILFPLHFFWPNIRVPTPFFRDYLVMLTMPIIKVFGSNMVNEFWASAHLKPFQELKMDVSPSYIWTNHEYDDPIIYIYIYNNKFKFHIHKYNIPTPHPKTTKNNYLPNHLRILGGATLPLKTPQPGTFFNLLQVFTEPTHPHLPLRTLEVLVDEVLFLEHLAEVFPCKNQDNY